MSDEREDNAYDQSPDGRSPGDALHGNESDELLAAYSAGELGAEEEAAVRHHLRHCPQCRQSLDELNRIRALLATLSSAGDVGRAEPPDHYSPARPVSLLPGVIDQMRHDRATLKAAHTPHTGVNWNNSKGELEMVGEEPDMVVEEGHTADDAATSLDNSSSGGRPYHARSYQPGKSLAFAAVAAALIVALLGAGLFGVLGPRLRHTAPEGNTSVPTTSSTPVTPTSTVPAIPLDPRTGLPKDGGLGHIQILGPDDAWALGGVRVATGVVGQPGPSSRSYYFLAHFDGTGWHLVRDTYTTVEINDLAMTSSAEGWAVGMDMDSSPLLGVILHYKKGRWERTDVPNTGGFYRLHMVSSDEGWAMGPTSGFQPASTNPPFIMHYSHGVWTHVTTTIQQAPGDFSFDSPDHGWLVGSGGTIASYSYGAWTKWPQSTTADLNSVSSLNGSDAWAIGTIPSKPPSTPPAPVVLHFDGRSWARVPVPALGTSGTLRQIVMANASDGWLFGTLFPPSLDIQPVTETPIVLHYSGGAWQRVTMPAPLGYQIVLGEISLSPDGDGWATADLDHLTGLTGKRGVDSSTFALLRCHAGVWSIYNNS